MTQSADSAPLGVADLAANKSPGNGAAQGLARASAFLLALGFALTIAGFYGIPVSIAVPIGIVLLGLGLEILIGLGFFWAWHYERRSLGR